MRKRGAVKDLRLCKSRRRRKNRARGRYMFISSAAVVPFPSPLRPPRFYLFSSWKTRNDRPPVIFPRDDTLVYARAHLLADSARFATSCRAKCLKIRCSRVPGCSRVYLQTFFTVDTSCIFISQASEEELTGFAGVLIRCDCLIIARVPNQ